MILPKVQVKKILYATDLSENARMAFAYAVSLANLYGAGLTILHVVPEHPDLDGKVVGYISESKWNEIKEQHFEEARAALIGKRNEGMAIRDVLDRFCKDVQDGLVDCSFTTDEVVVERGDAAEKILEVSQAKGIDLIVIGSHGYGTFKDAMMGGTARRVSRRAKMPVLLVRLPEEED